MPIIDSIEKEIFGLVVSLMVASLQSPEWMLVEGVGGDATTSMLLIPLDSMCTCWLPVGGRMSEDV